jgi:hypothetical protein
MVFGLKLPGGLGSKKTPAEPPVSEPSPGTKSSSSGAKSALTVNEFVARTKRCREKGLEPTKPEKIAYARYLGIDPIADGDLMWIADEALNAPLPSEWTEHHDSADRVFYYNVQTHASSWTHPLEQLHRDTYKSIVSFRSGDLSKKDQEVELDKLRRKCEDSEREAHKELQAWSEHTDEQGQKFYYNREHQRSVWTDPRPARCHALYLQMKALRVLSKQTGQAGAMPFQKPSLEPLASDRDDDIDKAHILAAHSRHKEQNLGSARSDTEGVDLFPGSFQGGGTEDEAEGRKRKKKKRKDEEGRSRKDQDELGLLQSPRSGQLESLPPGVDIKRDLVDLKKPSTSHVQEVREAIGLSGGTRLPAMSRGHCLEPGRLPSPPGDGLSTVGRTRVRAGIRLEPLQTAQ